MINLNQYFSRENNQFVFSRQQACDFAKGVANDFNAIHDADSSRFCVPGDLLFSVMLSELGISQEMQFTFAGMVTDGVPVSIQQHDDSCQLIDQQGKEYLQLTRSGDNLKDQAIISDIVKDYVYFSGRNFPHILVPLLEEQGLMLNRKRPLVIYENMSLHFDRLPSSSPHLEFAGGEFIPNGKRGIALLKFTISENGEAIGSGQKRMILGSLLPYEKAESDLLIANYDACKQAFIKRQQVQ
ncbi:DUF3581 family protein [Agarivorans sp. MS3-6]|uniref:DUF3581 family protein n=1 Tax=Agarivorans sp. TSD2052 TaxID=2937286 RepID=UPI00200FF73C|nr:DUF3581 family protein [Agarivorans sp. TSD2052]UPW17735.1 DUF3581 domain-containing protein [Agarivorans sp. TSD2052]